ncbi:MAG: hypothetical protein R2856_15140 [Caldilineaceae bacterium]
MLSFYVQVQSVEACGNDYDMLYLVFNGQAFGHIELCTDNNTRRLGQSRRFAGWPGWADWYVRLSR